MPAHLGSMTIASARDRGIGPLGSRAMSIRTIIYAASGGSAGEGAAELACRLARRFEAHVEGFPVRADPRPAALAFGDGFGSPVVGGLIERTAQEGAGAAPRAPQPFDPAPPPPTPPP